MADTPASSSRTPRTVKREEDGQRVLKQLLCFVVSPSNDPYPYQALARLASIDPLLTAPELYVFELLVRAHLLRAALRTARVLSTVLGAVTSLLPARDHALITSAYFTRLVVGRDLSPVRNLHVLEHAA